MPVATTTSQRSDLRLCLVQSSFRYARAAVLKPTIFHTNSGPSSQKSIRKRTIA